MTEQLVAEAMNDPALKVKMDNMVLEKQEAGEDFTHKDALEEILRPYTGFKESKQYTNNQDHSRRHQAALNKGDNKTANEEIKNILDPFAAMMTGSKEFWVEDAEFMYKDEKYDFKISEPPVGSVVTVKGADNKPVVIDSYYMMNDKRAGNLDGQIFYKVSGEDELRVADDGLIQKIINSAFSSDKKMSKALLDFVDDYTSNGVVDWEGLGGVKKQSPSHIDPTKKLEGLRENLIKKTITDRFGDTMTWGDKQSEKGSKLLNKFLKRYPELEFEINGKPYKNITVEFEAETFGVDEYLIKDVDGNTIYESGDDNQEGFENVMEIIEQGRINAPGATTQQGNASQFNTK